MAKQCTYCGKTLPRDDAQFCTNCGKIVPFQLANPASVDEFSQNRPSADATSSPQQPPPSPGQQGSAHQAIREQIAQQAPPRPSKYSLPTEPPAWISQLEKKAHNPTPPGKLEDPNVSRNRVQDASIVPADSREGHASADSLVPQVALPDISAGNARADNSSPEVIQLAKPSTDAPLRELRIKVWEQEEIADLSTPEEAIDRDSGEQHIIEDLPTARLSAVDTPEPNIPPDYTVESLAGEETVDDSPTIPLIASPLQTSPVLHASPRSAIGDDRLPDLDEIEELDTHPLVAQRLGQAMSPPGETPAEQQNQASQAPVGSPVIQRPVTPVLSSQPQMQPAQELRHTPPLSVAVPPVARPGQMRKSHKRLVSVIALLFILVIAGIASWIIVAQPFTVPAITKTTRPFQNTDLGVSLQYPQNWTAQVDTKNRAVYFYDDNHTDQVNISVVDPGGQSVSQYINKEAASLGMTGQKAGASLSFAGATWQQMQGGVLQSGASYTAILLVTIHNGRYYAILQLAPAPTYAQEDQLIFSNMRSSFQFI